MRLKRHVHWTEVGELHQSWPSVLISIQGTPDKLLTWIEDNLSGEWTSRTMTDGEYRREFKEKPKGQLGIRISFADRADLDRFNLRFGEAEGNA